MVLTLVVVLILLFAFKTNQKYEILETICSLEVLRSSSFHPGPPTSEQPRTLKSTSGPPTRTRGTSQFALPQASASNNLATRNLTVRQGCEADSYLRMTDCITQSMRQPHFWQTKPNCPTAPDCGQLSRIVSLQYTKGWPATSAATYTCIALLHIFRAHLRCESLLPHRRPDNPNANRPPKKYKA